MNRKAYITKYSSTIQEDLLRHTKYPKIYLIEEEPERIIDKMDFREATRNQREKNILKFCGLIK